MARILTAVAPDAEERVCRILKGHELRFVRDLSGAKVSLDQDGIELIVVGARFDESRMFDLLDYIRSDAEHKKIALYDLNTGLRDEPLCNLRWDWEVQLSDLGFSVFVVPARYVKGRKGDRVVVHNCVAQSIIESVRGLDPEFVFVYSQAVKQPKYRPIETMNNTAWQKWRERCGLGGFRPHDMRHTVGMRLREAGVSEATRADILWHTRNGMTAHYSVAQVLEIRAALELITDERHANNVSLASIMPSGAPSESLLKSLRQEKTA